MRLLRRVLHGVSRRAPHGDRAEDLLRASRKALRRDLRSMQDSLADLARELDSVQLQMQQLAALRDAELEARERMDSLARLPDVGRVSAHIRDAVARTPLGDHPVPHVIVSDVLPPEVLAAANDAIPLPIFFDRHEEGVRELRVPPRLASTYSITTWTFVADVVGEVLGPALVERFRAPLDRYVAMLCPSLGRSAREGILLAAEPGRIVERQPGAGAPRARSPWHFLTTFVCLASSGDSGTTVPVNSAVTVLEPAGEREHASTPVVAAAAAAPCTFEFSIGPDREARRLLLAHMNERTRQTWQALESMAR